MQTACDPPAMNRKVDDFSTAQTPKIELALGLNTAVKRVAVKVQFAI